MTETTSPPPSVSQTATVAAHVVPPRPAGEPPVVFFDGVCGFCNASVHWLQKLDRRNRLRFAPLQGETAAQVLGPLPPDPTQWSMGLWDEHGLHSHSTAAIYTAMHLGGIYKLAGVALICPRVVRDVVYRWIARNRYRWFGKHESCRIPTPAERAKFLP